jgi:hypothetical protein
VPSASVEALRATSNDRSRRCCARVEVRSGMESPWREPSRPTIFPRRKIIRLPLWSVARSKPAPYPSPICRFRRCYPRSDDSEGFSVHPSRQELHDLLGRSPDTASNEDLRRFQLHLSEKRVGAPTINLTISGLRLVACTGE